MRCGYEFAVTATWLRRMADNSCGGCQGRNNVLWLREDTNLAEGRRNVVCTAQYSVTLLLVGALLVIRPLPMRCDLQHAAIAVMAAVAVAVQQVRCCWAVPRCQTPDPLLRMCLALST
jgi:hypothetical protein